MVNNRLCHVLFDPREPTATWPLDVRIGRVTLHLHLRRSTVTRTIVLLLFALQVAAFAALADQAHLLTTEIANLR